MGILSRTESYFKERSIDSPRLTAEILLAHSLDVKRLDLYLQYDRPLQENELSDYKVLIRRRIQHEPVAYIIGEKGFFESDFEVARGVLIPRPETEILVEEALKIITYDSFDARIKKVLDLGTGSGAIIISLAKASPRHLYMAGDISLAALEIAKKNVCRTGDNKIYFFAGDWLSALKNKPEFDLIVSNPPYIPLADIKNLAPEISEHEPRLALDGGDDGLFCFRAILKDAHRYLVQGGTLLLEIGFDQKEGLEKLFKTHPEYESIEFIKDLSGHNRVARIKKSID
ncbi:MAG: protein-(glutamine-N5) methyltransferase, release factor-specific [Desulfobacterales bacterium RIFOXYA12_FULL_46_15]|nr:MAG: protein-(glutamine-N5) methyltransferase, release factor-specific [Desulfobacterales bacterium RIFOXYA12_FULL_46_15]